MRGSIIPYCTGTSCLGLLNSAASPFVERTEPLSTRKKQNKKNTRNDSHQTRGPATPARNKRGEHVEPCPATPLVQTFETCMVLPQVPKGESSEQHLYRVLEYKATDKSLLLLPLTSARHIALCPIPFRAHDVPRAYSG